jgi:hypothetical protein
VGWAPGDEKPSSAQLVPWGTMSTEQADSPRKRAAHVGDRTDEPEEWLREKPKVVSPVSTRTPSSRVRGSNAEREDDDGHAFVFPTRIDCSIATDEEFKVRRVPPRGGPLGRSSAYSRSI